jgi:hypothetical protein
MARTGEKSPGFGGDDYRRGALERLQEAETLLGKEQFSGSVYLAGRGVEGMLRAVIWINDPDIRRGRKPLATGHSLPELLTLIRNLGLLRGDGRDEAFEASVQRVGRLWFNNMRFASSKAVDQHWRRIGEVRGPRSLKKASGDFYEVCSAVVKRGEALCHH